MNLERSFQIAAVILVGVAAFFLWKNSNDGLFVAAVAGAVCFFLSVRFQIGERVKERRANQIAEELQENAEFQDHDEENLLGAPVSNQTINQSQSTNDAPPTRV